MLAHKICHHINMSTCYRFAWGLCLGVALGISLSARAEDKSTGVSEEAYSSLMANEVLDLQDLADGAEIQRRMFNHMTPSGFSWLQPMFPAVAPFDAKYFDEAFLDGLLGEDKYSVAVYPLSLVLDPKTRETLIYNAEGKLIVTIPADGAKRNWPEDADPARVILRLDLLPSEDVEPYLYVEDRISESLASVASKSAKTPKAGNVAMRSLTTGQFGIANIQRLTNGNFRLTVTNGTDVAEVFSYTVWHTSTVTTNEWVDEGVTNISTNTLWSPVSPTFDGLENTWDCQATNLILTNGVGIWEDSNISSNARVRFYGVARRADRDGDGLTDGAELFVYHTMTNSVDTDGDGMPDGWEVESGLNPLEGDGVQDEDTDGLSNFQEYMNGTSPNACDSNTNGVPDGWDIYSGTVIRGDIDGSGVLSANDMTAFDNILAQGSYNVPPVVFEQADLNNDGVLDVIDRRGLQDLLDGRPQLYILKPEMK